MEQRRKAFESFIFQLRHKGLHSLAGEIGRCLKKVSEGMETFEDILQKVHNETNFNQKEKYETDLKKEIKKLQRLRDQIKSWIASGEIKDKSTLVDTRKLIETQMERFKVVERETKTKAYSEEGLRPTQKLLATTREREELNNWLVASIDQMQIQLDQFECEIESLMAGKKKRLDKKKQKRLDELKTYMERHRFHMGKLETLMRMLDNKTLRTNDGLLQLRKFLSQVKKIKDDIEYCLESIQEPEFEENEFLYDDIDGLEEFDYGLVQQQALGNSALLAGGEGELVGTPTSTSGKNSPVSPIHSSDSSSDPDKRRKSSDDSSKVMRPVAMKANHSSPSPGSKGVVGTPPKGVVGTPNNSSPSSGLSNHVSSLSSLSSSPTQTHNYHNALNNVKSLCPAEGTTTSGIATANGLINNNSSNGSGNGSEEQLHLNNSSSSLSPHSNQPNQYPQLISIYLTTPTPPLTPVTNVVQSLSTSTTTAASLASLSPSLINSNLGLVNVVLENGLGSPPPPLPQESSSNSSTSSSSTLVSSDHHIQQQHQQQQQQQLMSSLSSDVTNNLLSSSTSSSSSIVVSSEHQQLLAQTLGGVGTSNLAGFSNNVNDNVSIVSTSSMSSLVSSLGGVVNSSSNNVIGGSSALTNSNSSGNVVNSAEPNSNNTNITSAAAPNNSASGLLGGGVSVSSHSNSTILSQQQQLQLQQQQQQAPASQPGNSRDTTTTSNLADYIRLQQEQMLMNRFMHHEGESMASLKSMAQKIVDRTGLNLNDPSMLENKTTEAHIPPLLGVAPLGPVPLQKEHQYQFQMLDSSHCHMPVHADSERTRQFLPRNPYPTPHYYPQHPLTNSDTLEFFQRLSIETLFFIFYYLEGTKAQYLAAKVLKKQSWGFHTKYMMWFQRHEEPKVIHEEYELGTYIYFDIEKWGPRKKDGFVFEYRYLEDRDLS